MSLREILFTPHVFALVERHLMYRDLIHLMSTCSTLYWRWISAQPTRWSSLRIPIFMFEEELGFTLEQGVEPLTYIREQATRALLSNDTQTFPCMGGCGKEIAQADCVTLVDLKYAICKKCSATQSRRGYGIVSRKLNNLGLFHDMFTTYMRIMREMVGDERFNARQGVIRMSWGRFAGAKVQEKHVPQDSHSWRLRLFKEEPFRRVCRDVIKTWNI